MRKQNNAKGHEQHGLVRADGVQAQRKQTHAKIATIKQRKRQEQQERQNMPEKKSIANMYKVREPQKPNDKENKDKTQINR